MEGGPDGGVFPPGNLNTRNQLSNPSTINFPINLRRPPLRASCGVHVKRLAFAPGRR
jgi:hypothetical protein